MIINALLQRSSMGMNRKQRGSTMFAMVACLAVVSMVVFGLMSSQIRIRGQAKRELQMEQTILLMDAAVDRIRNQWIASDGKLDDHFFDSGLKLERVGGRFDAKVDFERLDDTREGMAIRVTACLRSSGEFAQPTRRSRIVVLPQAEAENESSRPDQEHDKKGVSN